LVTKRRLPPPWSVEEQPACFIVRDHSGQQLAYVYFEDEPGRRSAASPLSISILRVAAYDSRAYATDSIHLSVRGRRAPLSIALFQLDGAVDLDRQPECSDYKRHLRRQRLVPFELAIGKCGADCLLDFALRGDADLLEKFAYAHIEYFFIHDRFSKTPPTLSGFIQHEDRPFSTAVVCRSHTELFHRA
jgi:hypothetical protein